MKHETFNSIIAALGLSLAAVTAWHQFAPASDKIEPTSEGRVELGRQLEINPFGSISLKSGSPAPSVGPVTWKVRIHNASDRPVSIVAFSIFLLSEDNRKIQYSGMRERLSPYDASLSEQILPDNISARETKAYLISLFMPFERDQGGNHKCEDEETRLRDLERCFFLKGRDLFGNPVSVVKYGSDLPEAFSVSWDQGHTAPRFSVIFETADGSKFEIHLSYFPNF